MMRSALTVDKVGDQRWAVALELLQEGGYIVYQHVGLTLRDFSQQGNPTLGALTARVQSEWQAENLTDARAFADLHRGEAIVADLISESPEIRELVDQHGLRYELLDDYGMGAVLIATMIGDQIAWHYAPWRQS